MKTTEERIADGVAATVVIFGFIYVFGQIIAAWLRGAFEAVTR